MPHFVLLHSAGVSDRVERLLPKLSETLETFGFSKSGIKAYALPASSTHIAGSASANFVHLTLRVLRKPDRTPEVLGQWAKSLAKTAKTHLSDHAVLTLEIEFLPDIYLSATA